MVTYLGCSPRARLFSDASALIGFVTAPAGDALVTGGTACVANAKVSGCTLMGWMAAASYVASYLARLNRPALILFPPTCLYLYKCNRRSGSWEEGCPPNLICDGD